jgi:hypothetical protein
LEGKGKERKGGNEVRAVLVLLHWEEK